jgi:hypothetical protein
MKNMRSVLIVSILILIVSNVYSIGEYMINDTLFVWANNGLSIRDTTSIEGRRIGIIPYGQKLKVLESKFDGYHEDIITIYPEKKEQNGNEIKSYSRIELQGSWVKIKYGEIIGFVFDGYLSKYDAPSINAKEVHENLDNYLERVFGKISSRTKGFNDYVITESFYMEGIYRQNIASKSAYVKYVLPCFSLEEIVVFIKNSGLTRGNSDNPRLLSREKLSQGIEVWKYDIDKFGDGILILTKVSNMIIIEHESSC